MPVQDNDDKRTADQPAVDAEEELRRKQAQAQEHQHQPVDAGGHGEGEQVIEHFSGKGNEENDAELLDVFHRRPLSGKIELDYRRGGEECQCAARLFSQMKRDRPAGRPLPVESV